MNGKTLLEIANLANEVVTYLKSPLLKYERLLSTLPTVPISQTDPPTGDVEAAKKEAEAKVAKMVVRLKGFNSTLYARLRDMTEKTRLVEGMRDHKETTWTELPDGSKVVGSKIVGLMPELKKSIQHRSAIYL